MQATPSAIFNQVHAVLQPDPDLEALFRIYQQLTPQLRIVRYADYWLEREHDLDDDQMPPLFLYELPQSLTDAADPDHAITVGGRMYWDPMSRTSEDRPTFVEFVAWRQKMRERFLRTLRTSKQKPESKPELAEIGKGIIDALEGIEATLQNY